VNKKKTPPWKKGKIIRPRKMGLFGTQGTGKTFFAASDPNSLILSVDDGADELSFATKWPDLNTVAKLTEAVQWLIDNDHDFKWVAVDTVTELMKIIESDVIREADASSINDRYKLNFGLGHIRASERFATFLKKLDELWTKKNVNLILICHERLINEEDPDASESYMRKVPEVHWRINSILQSWCSELLWFGRNISIKENETGANRAEFSGEIRIFTTETPGHLAKNRIGLPVSIDRDWEKFKIELAKFAKGETN
jgi:hypothetical protein